ncbi:hypothetical protein TNCT_89501 [Trichonephila clavata]|uniref:Uncharacterized protein n=1 Tax=Trichonephila clavata TaxID=2740835 RepID=A0A8X6KUC8_TRICU|nr:hypothetical protein TNCT_89501 [Trichonephila clavata]
MEKATKSYIWTYVIRMGLSPLLVIEVCNPIMTGAEQKLLSSTTLEMRVVLVASPSLLVMDIQLCMAWHAPQTTVAFSRVIIYAILPRSVMLFLKAVS